MEEAVGVEQMQPDVQHPCSRDQVFPTAAPLILVALPAAVEPLVFLVYPLHHVQLSLPKIRSKDLNNKKNELHKSTTGRKDQV